MSYITEEQKAALRITIQSAVQESIDRAVDNVTESSDETVEEAKGNKDKKESYKGKQKKEAADQDYDDESVEEQDDAEDDGEDGDGDGEEEEEESDRVDESDIFESMDVVAVVSGSRGNKTETFTVTRMTELQRKARTGKYEHLTVTTRSGKEKEYSVSNGRMIEM